MSEQFDRALAAIDDANAADPNIVTIRDITGPKERVHAALVTEWVLRLRPDADEALRLAARAHHLRRWTVPREASPPDGPATCGGARVCRHNTRLSSVRSCAASATTTRTIARTQQLVQKVGLGTDPDAECLEDALRLVFLEAQLADVAARLEPDTLARVLVRTSHKMSDLGRRSIADVPLPPGPRYVLDSALARDVVERYLDALPTANEDAIATTLSSDVERVGPYNDGYRGREDYARFLATTIAALPGYELAITRISAAGAVVTVELSETVDDAGGRLRTDEVVVFDVSDALIARVGVFLRASEQSPR